MPITIGSNIASLKGQRQLGQTTDSLSRTFERLSSGMRINHASDDAAGLAISSTLNAVARVYAQSVRNINDGLSLINIAEGALGECSGIAERIAELAEQAANGIYSVKQRLALDQEAQALRSEYNRILQTTEFNGIKLLDGSNPQGIAIQVGTNSSESARIVVPTAQSISSASGTGTFQSFGEFGVGARSDGVITSDFNSDGSIDLFMISDSGAPRLLLGNGDGTFQAASIVPGIGGALALAGGDFNNDGEMDAVMRDAGGFTIALGQGDGTFVVSSIDPGNTGINRSFAHDYNHDGKLDILTIGSGASNFLVYLGNGDGTFLAEQSNPLASATYSASVADVNGDGNMDFISGQIGFINVAFGQSNGTFSGAASTAGLSGPMSGAIEAADINNDGVVDLIEVGDDGGSADLNILLGIGNGTFAARVTLGNNIDAGAGIPADLNLDGYNDIVFQSVIGGGIVTFLNNGDGTFAGGTTYSVGAAETSSVTISDLNGDGVPDIVAGTGNDVTLMVFIQNSNPGTTLAPFSLRTREDALEALEAARALIDSLASSRGQLGAAESRLRSALSNNQSSRENALAASSRISDANIADESAQLTRTQILQNVASAVLAQANVQPQLVLELL